MTTLQAKPSLRVEELKAVIAAYHNATEQLKESHDLLMAEVGRLRSELDTKNRQLERRKRLAALGEMAAGVAHEIRNPLGSIQLYVDLLGRGLNPGSREVGLAEQIGKAVRGLDSIVTDMLTFTRVIEADRKPTLLLELVAEAEAEVNAQLSEADVRLDASDVARDLAIDLDGRLFKRVLMNLMVNAAHAMAKVEGERVVRISAAATDSGWNIRLADTGPGIDEAILEKVFNPFFTTKDTGTGLGLAIVHHIVEAHAGTITAANGPQGGAVFQICVPAMATNEKQACKQERDQLLEVELVA